MKWLKLILISSACLMTREAWADRLGAILGPPSLGQGGSNPLSIPPLNPIDWQLTYLTDEDREFVLSVLPGLFYGQRWRKNQFSIGFAGGLLVSTSGVGVGVSQSLHWETPAFWDRWRFEAEYRQLIGVTKIGVEFPYAIRLGFNYEI